MMKTCLFSFVLGLFISMPGIAAENKKAVTDRFPAAVSGQFICGSGFLNKPILGYEHETAANRMEQVCDKTKQMSTSSLKEENERQEVIKIVFCCIAK